jgi:predicted transposase/invertase (TIGR01784 family)
MQFLDPRNDVAFKKIFGSEEHKEITISFLNSMLGFTGDHLIVDVQFMNTEQHPMILSEKKENILDVLCTDQRGHKYIIEMQVEKVKEFGKRMVYYGAKTYALQLGRSAPYHKLAPVIVIAILDFVMFPEKKGHKSIHRILDEETYECNLPELTFVFVELKKFKKQEHELLSVEDKWIYFIKEINHQDHVPAPLATQEFGQACRIAERITWSEPELNAYDDAFVKATDQQTSLELATEKGIEKGQAKIIITMLSNGLDIETIASLTGVSLEHITEIKNNYKIKRT